MRYKIKIAGKIFEGTDTRALIRLAVAARRQAPRPQPIKLPATSGIERLGT